MLSEDAGDFRPHTNNFKTYDSNSEQTESNTTISCSNIIKQLRNNYKIVIRSIVITVFTYFSLYDSFKFIGNYLEYPVVTNLKIESNVYMEFPAVTVCDLNRIKSHFVNDVKARKPFAIKPPPGIGTPPVLIGVITETKFLYTLSKATDVPTKDLQSETASIFSGFTQLDSLSRRMYSNDVFAMIEECSYNTARCCFEDFTFFQNMQYGNCYTFNRKREDTHGALKQHGTGPESGLDLVLSLDRGTYMDITPTVGFRIVVHDPGQDPNPAEEGINVSPGFETHVSLTKHSIQRLPPPYKDKCFDYGSKNNNSPFLSQLDCFRSCVQQASLSRCSCAEPFLPSTEPVRLCDLKNATEMSCLVGVMDNVAKYGLPCECPMPCRVTNFQQEISFSSWPSTNSARNSSDYRHENFQLRSQFQKNKSQNFASSTFNFSTCRINASDFDFAPSCGFEKSVSSKARVKVFFKSFDHTIFIQTPMFTETEIISHIGGALGFWLGLSITSAIGYLEKVMFLFLNFGYKSTSKARDRQRDGDKMEEINSNV